MVELERRRVRDVCRPQGKTLEVGSTTAATSTDSVTALFRNHRRLEATCWPPNLRWKSAVSTFWSLSEASVSRQPVGTLCT